MIVILWMHRSGTSMLSWLLSSHRMNFSQSLMWAKESNPKWHFEDMLIYSLNELMLARIWTTWNSIGSNFEIADKDKHRYKKHLKKILAKKIHWCINRTVKEPRISVFFDLRREVANELDEEIKCVICNRNPNAVASSLQKRNGFSIKKWIDLRVEYSYMTEIKSRGLKRTVVDFGELLSNPVCALQSINDALELELTISHDICKNFVSTSISQHSQVTGLQLDDQYLKLWTTISTLSEERLDNIYKNLHFSESERNQSPIQRISWEIRFFLARLFYSH